MSGPIGPVQGDAAQRARSTFESGRYTSTLLSAQRKDARRCLHTKPRTFRWSPEHANRRRIARGVRIRCDRRDAVGVGAANHDPIAGEPDGERDLTSSPSCSRLRCSPGATASGRQPGRLRRGSSSPAPTSCRPERSRHRRCPAPVLHSRWTTGMTTKTSCGVTAPLPLVDALSCCS